MNLEQALENTDYSRLSAGDEGCWRELLARVIPMLYGMFIRKGVHAALAEELVQKTIFDGLRARDSYDSGKGVPQAWLMAIGRHNLAEEMRRRAVFKAKEADLVVWFSSIMTNLLPDEVLEREETAMAVRDALGKLEVKQRQVLELKYIEDLPARQIAGRMSMTEKAVHSLLYRARVSLRDKLKSISPSDKRGK